MITNERQYKITKARINEFRDALVQLAQLPQSRAQPWLRAAQKESIEEQIDQLQEQIDEYEKLKAGQVEIPDPVSAVSRTPLILIQSRIARGWDQEELANRLGMKKQQIQRYEQNNYAQATITVLSRVAAVLSGQPDPVRSPTGKRADSPSSNRSKGSEQKTGKRSAAKSTSSKHQVAKRKAAR